MFGFQGTEPIRAHNLDAGYDVFAAHAGFVRPGDRQLVSTGTRLEVPKGFAVLVTPRSGLALKHGVTVLNAPGLIDAGYTGDVGVILANTGEDVFKWDAGDRIAQLVFVKVETPDLQRVELTESDRGSRGFGSTGR